MKIKRNNKRNAKVKAALKKANRNNKRTLAKLGEGIDSEFRAEVDSFIE